MLLYSGHEDANAPHTKGFALMLFKEARKALAEWKSHGSRIIKSSFKTKKKGITMNVIKCHPPTDDCNDDTKSRFYERMESIVEM
ncbi:unnamed protein product [Schistosoma mattheei]|uniref:Uncharacterized protein n=1 Tax=Schistosoma mattheei TaxID=31246 RepID=A0A183P7T0_9TREM|nr:unnamed protein product [Schistosoma mattheei]